MAETAREMLRAHEGATHDAIRFEDETVSWADYIDGAERRAGVVLGMLNPERVPHVGTLLENTPELLFALAAGALGGYVTAGVNATRRGEGLARDIRRADCQVLLTDSRHRPLLEGLDLGDVRVVDTDAPEWTDAVAGASFPDQVAPVASDGPFMLIFTSGTSGDPKAVRVSHGTVTMSGSMLAPSFGLGTEDVVYLAMPLFHSNAIMGGYSPALAAGATMAPARRFSATAFLPDVRRYGVTYMNYVGKPLAYILDTPERPDDADTTLRAAFGNEAAAKDIPAFAERFGCRVWDAYGSTELAIIITRTEESPIESIGVPFPGVAVYDPVTGEECPPAVFDSTGAVTNLDECVGELVNTEGAGFFSGYYNDDAATDERMRDGMYWSGDLAYRDADGYVYMAGRSGDWLRVDGENMATGIIEEVLLRHPGVSRVAVYGLPDPRGVGDQLAAAIVPRHDAELTPEGLEEFLAAQPDLSAKGWPRWIRVAEVLPTTATNKILKRELVREGLDVSEGGGELWEREERGRRYSRLV